jgi:hypothetical protein
MKPNDEVYKVCWKFNGELRSCCQNYCFPEQYRAVYKIGEVTFPTIPNSKLFAFTNLESARLFKNGFWPNAGYMVIVKCKAKNLTKIMANVPEINYSTMIQFWKAKKNHKRTKKFITSEKFPKGTVLCDSITPIEVVK